MNLTDSQKQALTRQIEALARANRLIPEGYEVFVQIKRSPNRRSSIPTKIQHPQDREALLGRPLMEVYIDPTLGVRLVDRNKYKKRIQSILAFPPSDIDDEIRTLGGFARNMMILKPRLSDDLYRHIALWFQRIGVPYAQRPSVLYALVDEDWS